MIVQLSQRSPVTELADPVEFFLACHARIRNFTAIAGRIAAAVDRSPEEIAESARAVEHFFRVALPIHAADEDLSVAPRLRDVCNDPSVLDALDKMSAQHPIVDRSGDELAALLRTVGSDPTSLARHSAELADRVHALEALWLDHLGTEERMIFPALLVTLPDSERALVMAECRARRSGVVVPPDPPRS